MKAKLLLLSLSLTSVQALCQSSNCEELMQENEYLRKALAISKPTKTVTASGVDVNLIQCIGNTKEQTVTVLLTLINKDANKEFQFSSAKAIDMEGNDYSKYDIKIGTTGIRSKLYTDTPVKTTARFSKVLPSTRVLKLVDIIYYDPDSNRPGMQKDLQFKDLNIKWE